MIALIYDPARVDPDALGLPVNAYVRGVPARYTFTLPEAGYVVVRETWAGVDVLPGPVTPDDITALPDPGEDPVAISARTLADLKEAVRSGDTGTVIDPAVVRAAIGRLDAIIASGSVPDLPASPTNADVVAQVRTLTTAVNLIADATRDLARFDRAVIRLLS